MVTMPLLEAVNIYKYFKVGGSLFRKSQYIKAVDGVTLTINDGETLALVGESGSGKTTVGRIVLRLIEPTKADKLEFMGRDLLNPNKDDLLFLRRNSSIIHQNPLSSFNPWWSVKKIIREPLDRLNIGSPEERDDMVADILENVGLGSDILEKNPRDLSGGQQQRVAIARALVYRPKFIVADEPTSALDLSVRASILNLMKDFQDKWGISYLLITHDLASAVAISHRINVMYMGEIVESGETSKVIDEPLHPYTQGLIKSIPSLKPSSRSRYEIKGEIPSLIREIKGCKFHDRCPFAMDICRSKKPELIEVEKGRAVSCFLYS